MVESDNRRLHAEFIARMKAQEAKKAAPLIPDKNWKIVDFSGKVPEDTPMVQTDAGDILPAQTIPGWIEPEIQIGETGNWKGIVGWGLVVGMVLIGCGWWIGRWKRQKYLRLKKSHKMRLFTKPLSRDLDQMNAEELYRYLVENVEHDDAVQIVGKEITTNESRAQQLADELQQAEIPLQQSVEIAQQRKQILSYVERLKQISTQLGHAISESGWTQQEIVATVVPTQTANKSELSAFEESIGVDTKTAPDVLRNETEILVLGQREMDESEVKQEERVKLSGWMTWLQICIGLGIVGTLWELFAYLAFAYSVFSGMVTLCFCMAMLGVISIGIGFFSKLSERKRGTIFLAQSYVSLFIADHVLNALAIGTESKAIGAALVGGAWLTYLGCSKNLKRAFPDRRVNLWMKLWVAGIAVLLLLNYVMLWNYLRLKL